MKASPKTAEPRRNCRIAAACDVLQEEARRLIETGLADEDARTCLKAKGILIDLLIRQLREAE